MKMITDCRALREDSDYISLDMPTEKSPIPDLPCVREPMREELLPATCAQPMFHLAGVWLKPMNGEYMFAATCRRISRITERISPEMLKTIE